MKKIIKLLPLVTLFLLTIALPVMADPVSVNAGLGTTVDQDALATVIKDMAVKVGSLIGVVAIGALIFNGFRLGTASNEQKRAEALGSIKWSLLAVVLVGLAVMLVSFVASLLPS